MEAIERVRERVDIFDVAGFYGFPWAQNRRTQQIPCPNPMHLDGSPSARVYVRGDEQPSVYCFTCQAVYDAVSLTAAVEEVGYTRAAHILANRYGIDVAPTPEESEIRRLIQSWEDRDLPQPRSERTPETVRAALLVRRCTALPWEQVVSRLKAYETLLTTDVHPEDWLRATP